MFSFSCMPPCFLTQNGKSRYKTVFQIRILMIAILFLFPHDDDGERTTNERQIARGTGKKYILMGKWKIHFHFTSLRSHRNFWTAKSIWQKLRRRAGEWKRNDELNGENCQWKNFLVKSERWKFFLSCYFVLFFRL